MPGYKDWPEWIRHHPLDLLAESRHPWGIGGRLLTATGLGHSQTRWSGEADEALLLSPKRDRDAIELPA